MISSIIEKTDTTLVDFQVWRWHRDTKPPPHPGKTMICTVLADEAMKLVFRAELPHYSPSASKVEATTDQMLRACKHTSVLD